jgi:hypothetical protein
MRKGLVHLLAMALVFGVVGPVAATKPPSEPVTVLGPFEIGTPEGDALVAELDATDQFRFDASDTMPHAVGAGSFWSGIVDLVSGAKTIPQVLSDIDASWPS